MRNVSSDNQYHIDVESMLSLPVDIGLFYKDKESRYLGCNDVIAKMLKLDSRFDICGMTDYDLTILPFQADLLRKHDIEVMTQKKMLKLEHTVKVDETYIMITTTKMPLLSSDGKVLGVFGIDTLHHHYGMHSTIAQKLSTREADCLYYLTRGMTAREISAELQLSRRTVESYIDNLKAKLNCRKKSELVRMAIQSGLEWF